MALYQTEPHLEKIPRNTEALFHLAVVLGFEPRQTESESAVLPLHNTTVSTVAQKDFSEATVIIIAEKIDLSRDYSQIFSNFSCLCFFNIAAIPFCSIHTWQSAIWNLHNHRL